MKEKELIENYQKAKKALLKARADGNNAAERQAQKDFGKAEKALFEYAPEAEEE